MRSKPDPVDQPERTAHYDCAMCIAEMLHNTETVLLIFAFLQTNTTVQMRPSGGWGGAVPDRRVNVKQCICGCAWWLSDDVSLEQLSSLFTGAMSTCRRTLRLNMDAFPLRRYSARNDVCDMTLWLRSGIWNPSTRSVYSVHFITVVVINTASAQHKFQ